MNIFLWKSKEYVLLIFVLLLSSTVFAKSPDVDKAGSAVCEIADEGGIVNDEVIPTKAIFKIKLNNKYILSKVLPLKKSFYQSQTTACFIDKNYAYVLQSINTNQSSGLNQNIIYVHQIDFKGMIINSISPFANLWSCWNGSLRLLNGKDLTISATCVTNEKDQNEVKYNGLLDIKNLNIVRMSKKNG